MPPDAHADATAGVSAEEADHASVGDLAVLLVGVFACATSIIFIKASALHPILLSTLRLGVAAAAISPFFLRDLHRWSGSYTRRHVVRTLVPAVLLSLHFMTWIHGARLTFAVNSTLLVNMVPLVTPWLLRGLLGERLTRNEWAGTGMATLGLLVLTGRDLRLRTEYVLGDGICFGSMVLFASYLVMGRRNRDFPSLWLYLCPLYALAALMCFAVTAVSVDLAAESLSPRELLLALGLGLVPGVIGHSILNHAMTRMRGQVVGVANLGQFVFAGIMALVLLGEVPDPMFYPAAGLVVAGAWLAFRRT